MTIERNHYISSMKKTFTHYLTASQRPEWSDYYISYADLKDLLEKFVERRGKLSSAKSHDEIERERFYPEALCSSKSMPELERDDYDFVLMDGESKGNFFIFIMSHRYFLITHNLTS